MRRAKESGAEKCKAQVGDDSLATGCAWAGAGCDSAASQTTQAKHGCTSAAATATAERQEEMSAANNNSGEMRSAALTLLAARPGRGMVPTRRLDL